MIFDKLCKSYQEPIPIPLRYTKEGLSETADPESHPKIQQGAFINDVMILGGEEAWKI